MHQSASPPLRLTASLVAQHFRFRCDRKIRWEMTPLAERPGVVPEPAEPRPGAALLTRAGLRFERRRIRDLERRFGPDRIVSAGWSADGTPGVLGVQALAAALREPGPARWIVQPQIVLPDPGAFAARHGFDPAVALAPARPDLIRVGSAPGGRPRFGVADIKWSREGTLQHFAQVAFYSLLLEEFCRQHGVRGSLDTKRGWLWTRGARRPRAFGLAGYRHHVAEFLRDDLPRVAALAPALAGWHVGAGCAGCGFLDHCLAEAEAADDVCRVVGITPGARAQLRERGLHSVPALQKAAFRRDTYTGAHALESNAPALRARVQALSFGKVFDVEGATQRMAPQEGVRVCVTAEGDPVSGRVFALGVRVDRGRGKPTAEAWLADAGTAAAEALMLRGFLSHLAAALHPGDDEEKPSFQLFVYDRVQAELLRGALQRHLDDPAVQAALALLTGRLLTRGPDAGTAPGAVLLDVIAELFALPIPYAWELGRVSSVLQPAEQPAPFQPRPGFVDRFSSQVAFERIHEAWSGREGAAPAVADEIVRTVKEKLAALDSVVRAIRERSARRPDRPRLLMRPARLGAAPPAPLQNPLLERLRTFVLLEAAEASAAVRQLHALTSAERAARFECIRGLERVEVREDGAAVFEFDPACREAKFRPGDFALLLTNDDGRTLPSMHGKPWLARKRMVELVEYDLSGERPRLVLASEYGWETLERERLVDFSRQCVLDRGEADFTSRRVLATLAALDAAPGDGGFPRALLAGALPPGWLPLPLDPEEAVRTALEPAAAAMGRPVLNTEQETAWRHAFAHPVSVVWGPPGTGKTYLLAWTLLGMAAAAAGAGRPLRVLVTATTHRAIVNAMGRLASEARAARLTDLARLVKLSGRPTEADRDLDGTSVETLPEERLSGLLSGSPGSVIVGATPWALWKQMRAATADGVPLAPLFDVVVVDEASQMRVADALIPLSSTRPGARALFFGDDRQLAPIVRGGYERETLFGSAFAHFAAAFGRRMLRESRRMNRALVRYPRQLFYPGLVSRVPEHRLALGEAAGDDPVDRLLLEHFLQPEDAVLFCAYEGVRAAARNPWEAALVARLAKLARRGLRVPGTGEPYGDEAFRREAFAVISPHRAQNSAILAELAAVGWQGPLPVVDTVERMQGNEREMIVVSYGVADREYAEREAEFLLDPNRFNVAITRARAKLVVLVSREVLRALPRDEAVMAQSLALKGFPSAAGAVCRPVRLPGPGGSPVDALCYVWKLPDGGRLPPSTPAD